MVEQYIQIGTKRVFVDISSRGCGSGCAYCFTLAPLEPQCLLSEKIVDEICGYIDCMKLPENSIISLCPNTEPLKSEASKKLTLKIAKHFAQKEFIIQISTKELVDMDFLQELNNITCHKAQIRISISLPYLDKASSLEPYAANISERIKNFERISKFDGISSTLYLRPFNLDMLVDREKYVFLIETLNPDNICIGAEFIEKNSNFNRCTNLYDSAVAKEIFAKIDLDQVIGFADYLREKTGRKIFHSSMCNVANDSEYGCTVSLFNYDDRLCKDCRLVRPAPILTE